MTENDKKQKKMIRIEWELREKEESDKGE